METYAPTDRTRPQRLPERARYDAATVHAILDEAYYCHLSFVVDGQPRVLPTLHARVDDVLYLHGSTGSRPMLGARRDALAVSVAVTLLDGLVLARSQFHHSANYRSVIAHGTATLVTDPAEKLAALTAIAEKVAVGRAADSRPPNTKELAQTAVLALPLREVSAKVRSGPVSEDEEDLVLPHWAGVLPLRLVAGEPEPDAGVTVPVPAYLRPERSPWLRGLSATGRHVALGPLDLSHAEGLYTALDDAEVWTHLTVPRPANVAGMAAIITAALADPGRVPMVQRSTATGEVVGTTSYHAVDPANRSVAIGHTMLGRKWWRTGVNTDSKLLLMGHAFDVLGAVRVEWHTDLRNERSQQAIQRLGATREGVLRAHKRRADGTWRDTVVYSMTAPEWPGARSRLSARLGA